MFRQKGGREAPLVAGTAINTTNSPFFGSSVCLYGEFVVLRFFWKVKGCFLHQSFSYQFREGNTSLVRWLIRFLPFKYRPLNCGFCGKPVNPGLHTKIHSYYAWKF